MSATTDRIAIVTGANKGIGFEAARGIAKAGYVVLLAARNSAAGREAADTRMTPRFAAFQCECRPSAVLVQGEALDLDYLRRRAQALGVADLMDRTLQTVKARE